VFLKAKERVSKMQVRYLEVNDPIMQTFLEIYCTLELETPYNDFETH